MSFKQGSSTPECVVVSLSKRNKILLHKSSYCFTHSDLNTVSLDSLLYFQQPHWSYKPLQMLTLESQGILISVRRRLPSSISKHELASSYTRHCQKQIYVALGIICIIYILDLLLINFVSIDISFIQSRALQLTKSSHVQCLSCANKSTNRCYL